MASTLIVDQLQKTGGSTTALTLPTSNASASQYLQNDGAGALSWATVSIPASGLTHKSQWRLTTDFANSVDPLKLYWTAVEADDPRSTDTTPDSNTALGAPMNLDTSTGYWTFPTTGWWNVEFVCTYLPANYSNNPTGGIIKYATDGATFETVVKENGSTEGGYSQLSVGSVFLKIENTSEDQFSLAFYSPGTVTCRGNADSNYTFITCTKVGDI